MSFTESSMLNNELFVFYFLLLALNFQNHENAFLLLCFTVCSLSADLGFDHFS